jgi:hypothetical protein
MPADAYGIHLDIIGVHLTPRGKPDGVHGAEIPPMIREMPIVNPEALTNSAFSTPDRRICLSFQEKRREKWNIFACAARRVCGENFFPPSFCRNGKIRRCRLR